MVPDRPVTYRAARPSDVAAMVALVARCDATYAEWAPNGWVAPASDPEVDGARLCERLDDPGHTFIVAERDGEVAGFATIRPGDSDGRGHLSNLFVDPPRSGAGIGRGLLDRAVEAMRERGYTVCELSTQAGNVRARRMYERAGWRDTGVRHQNSGEGLEMAEYELDLPVADGAVRGVGFPLVSDVEVNPDRRPRPHPAVRKSAGAALTLGALGVVFGDIGTSPLYAIQTVFSADNHAVHPTQASVYGVISLVFWTITIIVSIKYVSFIMRADNDGEGGIMALIALVQGVSLKGRWTKMALVALGIFGASLFYGDGMITPAISVLSAVEGLKVAAPSLGNLVVEITLVVITVLFAIQRLGTAAVGRLFGPVMALWFGVLAVSGLGEVAAHPAILRALSPSYSIEFLADRPGTAFIALGSVVLAVTGAEALYADMGHFGRSPIRRAWFLFVFPALTLNYLGQGSLILGSQKAIDNPFFLLIPHWARIPMVLLATAATVIASQALISGAFSVTRQAVQLGFLPRLTIRHTSEEEEGQVYAPGVNTALFMGVAAIVIGFGSSQKLASAYGIAVTGTFVVTTLLFFVVVRRLWKKPLWLVLAGGAAFLTVDIAFFSANLTKVLHGGWFPLTIAAIVFTVLITWQHGREIVTRNRIEVEGPLDAFVEEVRAMDPPIYRSPGTGVFLNANRETTPLALRALYEHTHCLPESVVILSIESLKVPHHPPADRCVIDDLGYGDDGISHVTARFGFQDLTSVPATLRLAAEKGLESDVDLETPSYFLSQIRIHPTDAPGMARWRKKLFVAISRNSASPVEYFGLPDERTVTMGSHIEL